MLNVINSLQSIEDSLKKALVSHEHNKNLITEIKRSLNGNKSEIADFDQMDIFEKFDNENINENRKIDCHGCLVKADMHLNSVLTAMDARMNEYMSQLKALFDEVNAVKNVKAFIQYWDSKLLTDYQLKEYPSSFKKCFGQIPDGKRDEIAKLISDVKNFSFTEGSDAHKTVLNASNKTNVILDNNSNASNVVATEVPHRSFDASLASEMVDELNSISDTSLPSYLKKAIPKRAGGEHYTRGNTANIGLSVLDYTVLDKRHSITDLSMAGPEEEDLNESTNSDGPLNQAIQNIEEEEAEELNYDLIVVSGSRSPRISGNSDIDLPTRTIELPSFLDDSARIPEIEHYTTDNSWSQTDFAGASIFCSNRDSVFINRSIQENSVRADESTASVYMTDKSILNMQQNMNASASCIELSTNDFDYSFNKTPQRSRRYNGTYGGEE